MTIRASYPIATIAVLLAGHPAQALEQPDCASLAAWSRGIAPGDSYEAAPGIQLNRAFDDDRLVPLLGQSVLSLAREDTTALGGWLNECRQQAMRAKDQATGDALYAGMKEVKTLSRALRPYWSAQKVAENTVNSLVKTRPGPELAAVLQLAEDALAGQEVASRVEGFSRESYGPARQAAGLADQAPLLPEATRASLIGQLADRRASLEQQSQEQNAAYQALIASIAAVPDSEQGLAQLKRIAYEVDLNQLTREQQENYNRAFQSRRTAIQNQLQVKAAAAEQARRTQPAPAPERVAAVLTGGSIDQLSFQGIRPGLPYNSAKTAASAQFGYVESAYIGAADRQMTPRRKDMDRLLEQESRDGGLVNFRTREGVVGEVTYVEHFPGPVDRATLAAALQERFGKPDEDASTGGLLRMTWRDGGRALRVTAGNTVTEDRQFSQLQSSMQLSLWTDEFERYLVEARERCQRLADRPADSLSNNEKRDLLMGCRTP